MPSYLINSPKANSQVDQKKVSRVLSISLLTSFIILLIAYVVETNELATKGYEIRALEQQVEALEQSYEEYELKAGELQALNNMNNLQIKDFVAVEKVEYLSTIPTSSGVAVNQ
ncbi:MAG: hypothetical protein WC575_00190 [Patescibacteria group bacterium]